GIVCVVEAAGVLYAGGGSCFMDVVVLEGRVGVEGDGDGGVWSWLGTQGFLEGEEVCMLRGGGGFRGVVNCAGISIVRGILKVKGGECVVEFVMARVMTLETNGRYCYLVKTTHSFFVMVMAKVT